ncbi:MAG: hypothetical protein PHY42_01940 [Bacilli bacterium]|nr:hypothetical protein [Bacilli bacterium]
MTENQLEKFICLIQRNKYEIESIQYSSSTFKKVLIIKPKCFLVPTILVTFTDISFLRGEDLLPEVEVLNKQLNNNKPLIIMLIMTTNIELKDNYWSNGNIFVHLVVHDEAINCLYYEKNFHYLGSKDVRNLINLLQQTL